MKPFLTGTSNTRQADKEGRIRKTGRMYHRFNHTCCDATKEADYLTVASIPGLSTENINRHTVLGGSHKGQVIKQVLTKIPQNPNFNGHLTFWFLDNDFDFMMYFKIYSNMFEAVQEYFKLLTILFEGLTLQYERIYLVTAPFRQSDFQEVTIDRKTYLPFDIRHEFNNELRFQFAKNEIKIQNIPATLINLDEIWPEHTTNSPHYYCFNETEGSKIHYNRFEYQRFLSLLYCTLDQYGGLRSEAANPCSLGPENSSPVTSQLTSPGVKNSTQPLPVCSATTQAAPSQLLVFNSATQPLPSPVFSPITSPNLVTLVTLAADPATASHNLVTPASLAADQIAKLQLTTCDPTATPNEVVATTSESVADPTDLASAPITKKKRQRGKKNPFRILNKIALDIGEGGSPETED